jgi:hypothetical protein
MNQATARAIFIFCTATAFACGGDDGETVPTEILPASNYYAKCARPRTGTDPSTGDPYDDRQGTILQEKLFLRSWIDDLYLWYSGIPKNDPAIYANAVDYFNVLKTPTDRFHFTYATSVWLALSQSGVEASYGLQWVILNSTPPRRAVVAYNQPGSPAAAAGIERGAEIVTVDGVDVANSNTAAAVATLNAGMFPTDVNQTHTLVFRDRGATTTRSVMLTSAAVESTPVQSVRVLSTASGDVGYLVFNDHIATAEKGLVDAVTQLRDAGVNDLVVDMRYNGGGYLAIAAQLAYMIAGPTTTNGKAFESLVYNDKHRSVDPFSGKPLQPRPFVGLTMGFSVDAGQALPYLSLPVKRVFVLTGPGTCSASEAVMNGLAGVDVEVIQIGGTTCGKPYGFVPQDNCGTTYFAIQFQGVNNKGFGDYASGFAPGGILEGCTVADDFTHALGDPAEARLAAALGYRTSQTCPAASAPGKRGAADTLAAIDGDVPKSPGLQNRIVTP